MRFLLILNPKAAHGRAPKQHQKILDYFSERGAEFQVAKTEHRGHAIEIIKNADFSKYGGVIAAGGDGTAFEMLNGYFQNQSKNRIPVGVLPIGTGNSFARDLDLDAGEWRKGIDYILGGKTRKVDVARFRTEGKDLYFWNVCGLGLVSEVQKTADPLKFFGNIAYLLGVLYQTVFLKTYPVTMKLDGKTLERDVILIEVCNTKWTGRTFFIAPEAELDDGKLDIIWGNSLTRRRLLSLLTKISKGTHTKAPDVEIYRASQIEIDSPVPLLLGPDGELVGSTPVKIDCLKQVLDVFCP